MASEHTHDFDAGYNNACTFIHKTNNLRAAAHLLANLAPESPDQHWKLVDLLGTAYFRLAEYEQCYIHFRQFQREYPDNHTDQVIDIIRRLEDNYLIADPVS